MYRPYDTQWLTRASFAPTAAQRLRKRVVVAAVLLLVLGVAAVRSGYLGEQLSAPLRVAEAERVAAGLAADLERARMELAVERATRSELQRQADALSGQVAELSRQLEFLTTRNAQARASN